MRLAQTRDRGCVLVFNAQEAIHIFVQDGTVIHAMGAKIEGAEALDRAFDLKGSSYGWIQGAGPAKKDLAIDMREYMHKHSLSGDQRFGKTKLEFAIPHLRHVIHPPEVGAIAIVFALT